MVKTVSPSVGVRGISLQGIPSDVASVDVAFDGHRVWSIDARTEDTRQLAWPEALRPYLTGSSRVTLSDSASTRILLATDVTFTNDAHRVRVQNDAGVSLSLNKWMRLAPSLTTIGEFIQERILDRSEEIIGHLSAMGLRPFVVGGTLLGGVRDGKLLPHDDDADIAYLSEYTHPAEVAAEGFRVGRQLQALGYELMRHSATHMQLHFRDDVENADYYIDVFAAFFTDDGHINQPFHVRGPMRHEQMLPFSEVTISGRTFPAPRDTEAWLVINYDADWHTPIPGFEIITPEPTRRRFQNWFGSFNFGRHFWNDWYSDDRGQNPWHTGATWIRSRDSLLSAPQLLELGAGDGTLSQHLATSVREVIATDYAREPLERLTHLSTTENIRVAHVNLHRLNVISAAHNVGIKGRFDVVANHVLEQVTDTARPNIYRIIRQALRSGGAAIATMNTIHARDLSPEVPPTWHLTEHQLAEECAAFGLALTVSRIEAGADRRPVGITFHLDGSSSLPPQEISMKQHLVRILRTFDPRVSRRRMRALESEVATLKSDIDEFRAQNARLAELIDVAEERFSPGASSRD